MKKTIGVFILMLTCTVGLAQQDGLDAYLTLAANQNPGLKAKYHRYLSALEEVDQQAALPDPTLSFGYFISPVETRVGAQRLKLSLSQMFPWKGTIPLRKQQAAQTAQVRFQEFMEAKNKLFLDVKSQWLRLYELEKEIEITEANLLILESYEPITKTKYEANLVSLADLVRVQINIENVRTQLNLLRLKRPALLSDFNLLLNQPDGSVVQLPDRLAENDSQTQLRDSIFTQQPRLLAAQGQLDVLESRTQLARLQRKPSIGFGLDYAMVDKRTDVAVDDNGKDILMPMVSLSLPIFGKKNRAAQKQVELDKKAAEFQLEATQKELSNAWNQTTYQLEQAQEELTLYANEIEKTELLLRLLTSEYSNDSRNFEELLLTQQRLLQIQLAEVKASIKHQQALFYQDYLTAETLNEHQ